MIRISIVIPVYNAEKYLERAVVSALEQPETGEVVLVEDDSLDNALELCQKLEKEHEKVKLFRHPDGKNHGAGASRNLGIQKAQFDYIAFLDADDYYLPNRFKKTVEVFIEHPDADGVYECIGTDFSSEEKKRDWFEKRPSLYTTVTEPVEPEDLLEAFTIGGKGYFHLDGLTVKKDIFEKIGYFDVDLKLTQDTEISVRMAALCRLYPGSLDKSVANRFWHEENRVGKNDENQVFYVRLGAKKMLLFSKKISQKRARIIIYSYAKMWFQGVEKYPENPGFFSLRIFELKIWFKMIGFYKIFVSYVSLLHLMGVLSKKFERRCSKWLTLHQ